MVTRKNEESAEPTTITAKDLYNQARQDATEQGDYDVQAGLNRLSAWMREEPNAGRNLRAVKSDAAAETRGERVRIAQLHGSRPSGPVYRSIVAIDLEGSTTRSSLVKAEQRRAMYDLLSRALEAVPIADSQREQLTDRGDGVLLLIRPDDDVPKVVLLDRLIPLLAELLTEYNATVVSSALRIRLRAVVHAGEVHSDSRGFFGEAIDIAIRLLESSTVKRALREAESPLVLVVSEDIYRGIVTQGYIDVGTYRPAVRVRVADRQHRGWMNISQPSPSSALSESNSATGPRAPREQPDSNPTSTSNSGRSA